MYWLNLPFKQCYSLHRVMQINYQQNVDKNINCF
jgi:hypothetical protein